MRTVTIGVSGIAQVQARLSAAFRGEPQGALISFASVELLWAVMTPQRWALLQALVGREPLAVPDLADRTGRDVADVRDDVEALARAGVEERAPEERISFPFDSVHVDFTMERAA